MDTTQLKNSLDAELRRFAVRLRKNHAVEIEADPGFRAKDGKAPSITAHRRPGRKASSEIKQAAELYLNLYSAKGVPGNWHELAKRLVPDYAGLSVEMQKYHRFRLRSQTHSYLYDQRSRLRRSAGQAH